MSPVPALLADLDGRKSGGPADPAAPASVDPGRGVPAGQALERQAPRRMCVGCRRTGPQGTLIRLVLTGEEIAIGRRLDGRGAWLCAATPQECLASATRRHSLARAFRRALPAGAVERLADRLEPARSYSSTP